MENIWAPWRMEYIQMEIDGIEGCFDRRSESPKALSMLLVAAGDRPERPYGFFLCFAT